MALAAIQGLYALLEEKDAELCRQRAQLEELQQQIETLMASRDCTRRN